MLSGVQTYGGLEMPLLGTNAGVAEWDRVGEGGSAFVYEVVLGGKVWAVKVLSSTTGNQMLREVTVGKYLEACEVKNTLTYGQVFALYSDKMLAVTMPLCTPLVKAVGRQVDDSVVVTMAQDLLVAVEGMHACGVVHQDLKPDNVLVQKGGIDDRAHFIVGDLGSATFLSNGVSVWRGDANRCTINYKDPATCRSKAEARRPTRWHDQAKPYSDVFSLGLTFMFVLFDRLVVITMDNGARHMCAEHDVIDAAQRVFGTPGAYRGKGLTRARAQVMEQDRIVTVLKRKLSVVQARWASPRFRAVLKVSAAMVIVDPQLRPTAREARRLLASYLMTPLPRALAQPASRSRSRSRSRPRPRARVRPRPTPSLASVVSPMSPQAAIESGGDPMLAVGAGGGAGGGAGAGAGAGIASPLKRRRALPPPGAVATLGPGSTVPSAFTSPASATSTATTPTASVPAATAPVLPKKPKKSKKSKKQKKRRQQKTLHDAPGGLLGMW